MTSEKFSSNDLSLSSKRNTMVKDVIVGIVIVRGATEPVAPPSPKYVPGPEHLPSPNYVPGPEHPPSPVEIPYTLPADASPTAASPGYVIDFDPDEDPEEDPEDDHADYPADRGDGGGALAPGDSFVVPIIDHVPTASDTKAFETDESAPTPGSPHTIIPSSQTHLHRAWKTVRLEPPILTDTGAPLGYRAVVIRTRALLPSTSRRNDILEADLPPRKRACLTTPALGFKIRESSTPSAARDRPDHHRTPMLLDREVMYAREAWADSEDRSAAIEAHALIDRGIATALVERDADMSRNGNNNNDLGTGGGRQVTTQRECTYTDFLKCQPMSFQGIEGVVKFASYTLQGSALTWWKSYMRAVGQDVAYAMPWAALKRMITDKYCPKESAKVERYIDDLPDMIHGSGKASKPQSMPCAPKCINCKKIGHLACDCRGRPAATNNNNNTTTNNNNQRAQGANPRGITYFECGV
nr:hypothetical protein [Tanacetum cinerariifolium]